MHITFEIRGESTTRRTAICGDRQTLLDAAHAAGVEVAATCGGRGRCRSCRIKVLSGEVPPATVDDYAQLGHDEVRELFRLACQTRAIADCTVLVAPPASEVGFQFYIDGADGLCTTPAEIDSGILQHVVVPPLPASIDEQTSQTERALAEVDFKVSRELNLRVLRRIPAALDTGHGRVTFITFNGTVIDVEAGDTRGRAYGVAIDVGTTTIVGNLLDLTSGERLASIAKANPQAVYGGDLMSRVTFAQTSEKNFTTLQARVIQTLNRLVTEACDKADVAPRHIYKVTVVANPCMHHLLLGLDVSQLGFAPYSPVVRDGLLIPACDLPLKSVPRAQLCLLPLIAGFVGSDALGALLATRIERSRGTHLLVDIGTNTEVIMATSGNLVACSAPAGPAFEGGQIRYGMRAALGAIEAVQITDEIRCKVVGDKPAIGICGSGLIDAVASMIEAGFIESDGFLRTARRDHLPPALQHRLREGPDGGALILVPAAESGRGEDIAITQGDIRQLQLAKGAIYSAIVTLQRLMGVTNEDVDGLLLCGGFGNYIDVKSAKRIRMLPDIPCERIRFVGNAALAGAELGLLSESARSRAAELARRVMHVSLTEQPDYQDIFVDALAI